MSRGRNLVLARASNRYAHRPRAVGLNAVLHQ
jgi:hypothetical protein